jgi:ATP/maltotriose-dependent transcriptional regulator MalT
MLNEKAKEVRNTVKDVNIARKEVDKIASRTVSEPAKAETNESKESKEGNLKVEANAKAEVKKPTEPVRSTGAGLNNQIDTSLYTNINKVSDGNNEYGYKVPTGSKDLAKERLIEIMKNSSKTQAEESARAKAKAKEEPPKPKTGLELVSKKPVQEVVEEPKVDTEQISKASAETDEAAEAQIVAELAGDIGRTAKAGNIEEDVKTEINDEDSAGMSAQAGAMEVPDGTVELSAKPVKDLSETSEEEKPAKSKSVKKVSRRSVTKKAAGSQAGELVKMTAPKVEDIVAGFDEYMTNSDKIMELSKQGVSNKEIAKVLNIGLGEVKLVVDLLNSSD